MKEYKLKINGNEYNVSIDRLDGQSASVSVNGRSYSVETGDTSASAPPARPGSETRCDGCTRPRCGSGSCGSRRRCRQKPAAGRRARHPGSRGRHGTARTEAYDPRSDEDGKQHRLRQSGNRQGNQSLHGRFRTRRRRAADDRVDAAAEYLTIGNVNGPAPAGPFLTRCPCIPGFSLRHLP